ncbi:glycosyltransferase involved in cell wall biosynthesis [Streptacidiphilus sp. MAP12-33]|uniref:glycosyltransferase family 2 protein n=1 Tax=Streptacidiphilus sp. MAP12-33 TaxID=3156266 RepID=UPI003516050D
MTVPAVSICIPVYNRVEQLERALRSARAQTFADLEIVVVDNASTDGSHQVALRHAAEDPRVRVERNDTVLDKPDNWRRTVATARAPYLVLLFSDDWLAPQAVQRLYSALDGRPDIAFAYCGMTWRLGEQTVRCYTAARPKDLGSTEFLYRSATLADLVPVTTSCVLLRTADARGLMPERIPSRLDDDTHTIGIGYTGMLLWRCALRYPLVHRVGEELAFTADQSTGEQNSRTRYRDRYELLWWGHRNAVAHFVGADVHDPALRLRLTSALYVNTVPLRPGGPAVHGATFRRLFPGFGPSRLRLPGLRLLPWVLYRLLRAPDPVEILGPRPRRRTAPPRRPLAPRRTPTSGAEQ